jgi:hypothetical protein
LRQKPGVMVPETNRIQLLWISKNPNQ